MATCNACRAPYTWGDNPCSRCGQDNSFWEEQRALPRLERFANYFWTIWGIIAIGMDVFAFVLLVYFILASVWQGPDIVSGLNSDRSTIMGQFLAWFMSFISIFIIYATRFELWNFSWIRHVLKPQPPNLYSIAVILFLLGILLLLTHLTLTLFFAPSTMTQPDTTSAAGRLFEILLQKIIMPAMYGFIFTFFTAGSMLMNAGLFVDRLNEKGGQPIFMNTKRLADVVQQAAAESLEVPVASTKLSAIKRIKDGGINMILNYLKAGKIERRYEVEANRWGQINSLIEDPNLPKS